MAKDNLIQDSFGQRIGMYQRLIDDKFFELSFSSSVKILLNSLNSSNGGKILIFGNGGSAAEAQHFAAELVCMFQKIRKPFAAMALTTDSSILTAQSNDFGFESVFSRQVEALCRPGDVVIGLTTSDGTDTVDSHSMNICRGFQMALLSKLRL